MNTSDINNLKTLITDLLTKEGTCKNQSKYGFANKILSLITKEMRNNQMEINKETTEEMIRKILANGIKMIAYRNYENNYMSVHAVLHREKQFDGIDFTESETDMYVEEKEEKKTLKKPDGIGYPITFSFSYNGGFSVALI